MPRWIGGSRISITRFWVKEFLAEGEPALRNYIVGIRQQYLETKAAKDFADLAELKECGKYAAVAYRKAYGKDCPK